LVRTCANAICKSDEFVPGFLEKVYSIRQNFKNSPINNLMHEGQKRRRMSLHDVSKQLLRLGRGISKCVLRVKVPQDKLLPALGGNLTNEIVIRAVWGTHERRRDANETLERLFHAPHLVVNLVKGQRGEVAVRPCVRGDLMAFAVDRLDVLSVLGAVNATPVIAIEKESPLGTGCI